MLLLNTFPFFHATGVVLLAMLPYAGWPVRLGASLVALYLLPPSLARVIRGIRPLPEGRIPVRSGDFLEWWALLQLQVVFCRLTFLEELLRMVPSLYSAWLRLWGAKIGRLTYWAAGTLILDRSFLEVGDDVIFGAGVRINAHVLEKRDDGELELLLGTIKIGDRASVGGYSLITSGCEIAAGEATHAFLIMPPFSRWEHGKRAKAFRDGLRQVPGEVPR